MRAARFLVPLSLMIATALILFRGFQGELSGALVDLATHPDIEVVLEASAEDQRKLARLDPENRASYRARFDRVQEIKQNFVILEQSSQNLVSRYETVLVVAFGITILLFAGLNVWDRHRQDRLLATLQEPLAELAAGGTRLSLPPPRKDVFGRMASMMADAHQLFVNQRNKLAYLENLSSWQEAARRQAHEMRTPLTSMRLETDGLRNLTNSAPETLADRVVVVCESLQAEIGKLAGFTDAITSFAKIGAPQKIELDLADFARDFARLFADYWPNLTIETVIEASPTAIADRSMIRQVLVNLAGNASDAIEGEGRLTIEVARSEDGAAITVRDNGPGIPSGLRIFEPYVTTKEIGAGMGLGLPISRKIMLEHGGDLEWVASDAGACFRLVLPSADEVTR